MRLSIKWKIVLFSVFIILITIGTQLIGNHYLAKPFFIEKKSYEMGEMFNDLKHNFNNHEAIDEAMLHYVEDDNIDILIVDDNNKVIYSNDEHQEDFKHNDSDFSKTPEVEFKVNERTQKESLTLFGEIKLNDEDYYVVLDTPVSAVEKSVSIINQLNLYIALFSGLLGAILATLWGKYFSKPIIEIDQVAKQVASLNFTKRVKTSKRKDEIGQLSDSINNMSDQLSTLINDLQAANKKLAADVDIEKQHNNMRKDFIANVSHELKSPLALLVMYAENLKNDVKDIDKDFYYDVIIDESQRLGDLVKKLLDLSALENGVTAMIHDTIKLGDFVDWICDKKEVMAQSKGITIKRKITKDIEAVGDIFYLEQALSNYLDNAITHTFENGSITVELYEDAFWTYCSVSNEGPIVPKDERKNIWSSFYKLDKSHTPSNETHAGLGLYIVKTIIDAHRGQCGASEKEGNMCFWIKLPK